MMKQLRPYQRDAVNSIWNYLNSKDGNPVVAAPTGAGKSLMIAFFVKEVIEKYPNQRIIIVTHVKELVAQNCEELLGIFPNAPTGIFSAGLNRKEISQITFATIGSIVKVAAKFGHIDFLLIDEVHMADTTRETMYKRLIDELKVANPNLKAIGFSATPYRLKQGLITDDGIFTDICFDNTKLDSFNYLLEEGYLSYLVTKQTVMQLDVSNVKTRNGDFVQGELEKAINKTEITYAAILESLSYAKNRHCIVVFAAGIQHSNDIADMFNETFNISAISIHSLMSDDERDMAIANFKAGKYRVAVNNIVLGIGVNIPQIDMIIDLQPTESTARHVQKYGRGTRPVYADGYDLSTKEGRLEAMQAGSKYKHCLILDFAGNTYRNGAINDPVIPMLGHISGRKNCKTCRRCFAIVPLHYKICNTFNDLTGEICTYEFEPVPRDTELYDTASTDEVIVKESRQLPKEKPIKPIKKWFDVDSVAYKNYTSKLNGKPMLLVEYQCATDIFCEHVALEHDGFVRKHAENWWRLRYQGNDGFVPYTVGEAIKNSHNLRVNKKVFVHINTKYPKIENYSFE